MSWGVEFYPHSGRYLVSNGPLQVHRSEAIASFAVEADAARFAAAMNAWEWQKAAPDPSAFRGCEPYPEPDRYKHGFAVFDRDPALRQP